MDKKKFFNKLMALEDEFKAYICDNCELVDRCKYSYTGYFRNKRCFENYQEIKEELSVEEENENY